MPQERSNKFPYTQFHKAYGFKPGKHRIQTVSSKPEATWREGSPRLVLEVTDDFYPIRHWLWFDGNWVEIVWDKLLDPMNLRLRREFNEELAKCRIEDKKESSTWNIKETGKVTIESMRKAMETVLGDPRQFINIRSGRPISYYRDRYHQGHNMEPVEGGFFCHDCKRGVRQAQPTKGYHCKDELGQYDTWGTSSGRRADDDSGSDF